MTANATPEGFISPLDNQVPLTINTPAVVHTRPQVEEQVYHAAIPYDGRETQDQMEEFRNQFQELHNQVKALKGKESFGKSAYELCLVPNVKAPPKFKVPDFEKFKGDTNPNEHLTLYVRRMSMYTDDDKLLIHCF